MKSIIFSAFLLAVSANAFVEESIQFPISEGIALSGYLTRPEASGRFPILVIQLGSGQGTTDNKSRDYNPFALIARQLADEGFVVLRFDKRGTGYNSADGSFADATFSDYVNDLKAAVRAVQKRSDVLNDRVFLLGHSLGGPVISVVASDFAEVRGIILSASPTRQFVEYNLEQNRHIYELGMGLTGSELEAKLSTTKHQIDLLTNPQEFCAEYPLDCQKNGGEIYLWGQRHEFWNEVVALDPIKLLKPLKCQIFGIYGTSDWVISSSNDGGLLIDSLSSASNFSSAIIPELDHFLAKSESKKSSVETYINATRGVSSKMEMNPRYLEEISKALRKWNNHFEN